MLQSIALLIMLASPPMAPGQVTVHGTPAPGGGGGGGGDPSIWTFTDIGGDAGTGFTETDSDTLTIQAKGETDQTEGGFVHQEVFGDVQVVAKFLGFTAGTPETFTFGGIRLADDLTGDPRQISLEWPVALQNRGKYRNVAGSSMVQGIFGVHTTLPVCQAITWSAATQLANFFESQDAECDSGWELIQEGISVQMTGSVFAGAHCTSHNDLNLVTCSYDRLTVSNTITIVPSGGPTGPRNIRWEGDLETGEIQTSSATHDGFFIKTLLENIAQTTHPDCSSTATATNNCNGGTMAPYIAECSVSGGGAGVGSGLDTRVSDGETPPATGNGGGAAAVSARAGTFFMRHAIYFDKPYCSFAGNSNKNKPRTNFYHGTTAREIDYDLEFYTGFSIYIPENYEHETGRTGARGKNMLMNIAGPGAETMFSLNHWVPNTTEDGFNDTVAHWILFLHHNESATNENAGNLVQTSISLGSVVPDLGKWTDFIIRWRINPFMSGQGYPCPVNPRTDLGITDARNQSYPCDSGIVQIWKSQGSVINGDGDRSMVRVLNLLNTGVGLVPSATSQVSHSFRQYKHGWHQQPTDVVGPVWMGHDEMRYGGVIENSTTWQDVHPTQKTCAVIGANCP